jgi:hypothetical protein
MNGVDKLKGLHEQAEMDLFTQHLQGIHICHMDPIFIGGDRTLGINLNRHLATTAAAAADRERGWYLSNYRTICLGSMCWVSLEDCVSAS